jgi:dihydroneopterin aldolase
MDRVQTMTRLTVTHREVFLEGLHVEAVLGIYEHERSQPQPLRVDIAVDVVDLPRGLGIQSTVDYDWLAQETLAVAGAQMWGALVEDVANALATRLLSDARISGVRLRIVKTRAVAAADRAGVALEMRKDWKPGSSFAR